jgi:hypothetical protein
MGRNARHVTMEIIAMKNTEAKGMLCQAGWGFGQGHARSRDDLPHGSGRWVSGEQEKLSLL